MSRVGNSGSVGNESGSFEDVPKEKEGKINNLKVKVVDFSTKLGSKASELVSNSRVIQGVALGILTVTTLTVGFALAMSTQVGRDSLRFVLTGKKVTREKFKPDDNSTVAKVWCAAKNFFVGGDIQESPYDSYEIVSNREDRIESQVAEVEIEKVEERKKPEGRSFFGGIVSGAENLIDRARGVEKISLTTFTEENKCSSVYFTNYSNHNNGNVDSCRILNNIGVTFVQDFESHNKPDKAGIVQSATNAFCEAFEKDYEKILEKKQSKEEFLTNLCSSIRKLGNQNFGHEEITSLGKGELVGLVNIGNKNYIWYFQGGDGSTYLKAKEGATEELKVGDFSQGLSTGHIMLREVKKGDQVFSCTDGLEGPAIDDQKEVYEKMQDGKMQAVAKIYSGFAKDVKNKRLTKEQALTEAQNLAERFNYALTDEEWNNIQENYSELENGESFEPKNYKQGAEGILNTIQSAEGDPANVVEAMKSNLAVFDVEGNKYKGLGDISQLTDDCAVTGFQI